MIGVLALQGDFAAHAKALARFDLASREIRRPADLTGVRGLVLPGGESSTMLRLLALQGLEGPLRAALVSGVPVLATCAGMILLATEVVEPSQASLGVIDMTVARNGYGRQIRSGRFPLRVATSLAAAGPDPGGVFIRAPRVLRVGPEVEILAWRDGDPALVAWRAILAAAFHPELETDHFVSRRFAEMVKSTRAGPTIGEPTLGAPASDGTDPAARVR